MTLAELVAPYGTVTVAGLAKNAGKTTVLNHLMASLPGPFGLASLGLDGERTDHLTGLPKPRVVPPAGTLVVTGEQLRAGLGTVARLGFRSAVGEVVLVEADGGAVIVSGPTRLDELDAALEALRRAGAARILLEGALGRLGTAAPGRADAVVLAAGASLARAGSDYGAAVGLALDALDLPVVDGAAGIDIEHAAGWEAETAAAIAAGRPERVALDGALTGPLLERLMRAGTRVELVVEDATRILARPQQVARARRRGVAIAVRRPLAIVAVTSSPFHPDAPLSAERAFAELSAAVAGRWPVADVVSGMIAP